MLYKIREKFWSWGNNFNITDAEDQQVFCVKGKVFSFGKQLSFQDIEGRELLQIRQKVFSLRKRFHLLYDGRQVAEVVKAFSLLRPRFDIFVAEGTDYLVQGNYWAHEFIFQRDGRQVASVSKKLFSWTDSYGVDILPDLPAEDVAVILAACIVIDQVLHDGKKGSRN